MTTAAGDLIGGRYRLDERLSQGSTGVVWRADELLQGRPIAQVAVKIFTVDVNHQEIAALATLQHGHILAYRTTVEHQGRTCLVTEYADGGDAQKILQAYPQGLPEEQVEAIWDSIAQALQYLHERSWVHRDVKPGNILHVGTTAKLGDVGTAKLVSQAATRHTVIGSMAYAAPETFNGQVSAASDLYSLGVTAFELLTGRLPFDGPPGEVMRQHLHVMPQIPAHLPNRWQCLLSGSLEKDPDRRLPIRDLRNLLRGGQFPPVSASPTARAEAEAASDAMIADYLHRIGPGWASAQAWATFWTLLQRVAEPLGLTDAQLLSRVRSQADLAVNRTSPQQPRNARPDPAVRPAAATTPKDPPTRPTGTVPRAVPVTPREDGAAALHRELLAHIDEYGTRWSSSDVWLPFWQRLSVRQAAPDERETIRLGERLIEARRQARTRTQRLAMRVLQWAGEQKGRNFEAREWLSFLDTLEVTEGTIDAAALGRCRDEALVRLWPSEVGVLRRLSMGKLPALDLVYLPQESIHRAVSLTKLLDDLSRDSAARAIKPVGAWIGLQPLSVAQWYGLLQVALPAKATKPEAIAKVPYLGAADRLLPALRERYPLEDLRLATRNETAALRELLQRVSPPDKKAQKSATPATLGGLLAEVAVNVLQHVGEELSEWHCDEDAEARGLPLTTKRAVRLVSPISW